MERGLQPVNVPFSDRIDQFVKKLGEWISWVYALLILVIITQVLLRKGFSSGFIILEELQWHFYAVGFMFGLAYCQALNSHIRVDLLYSRFSPKARHIIEILGMIFFVLPFIYVVFVHSLDFVYESWRIGERSDAPAGLPYRWLIKSVIPVSFSLLALTVFSRIFREAYLLLKNDEGDRRGS